ncbi:MAG TPA: amidase [Aestuariivirgaceae bacterium]|nr:amidase [Aestuariivirgaceae bacterium]
MDLPASIDEAAARLRTGELTCTQLVRTCLERIDALQPKLNAFITVTADAAMARADALERELRAGGDRGRLHGMPIVCKDCLDTAGVRTTIGSRYFSNRVPAADARVVERLTAAGALILGKTNMNEFAAGTSGKNVAYGDVRNPWSLDHSPGGSSSGTAAAVATGMALAGVGTDTGGSIRIPAACTGIVGIRPTPGRVSALGCFPRSFSFDTLAPLARTVRDCALMFEAMAEDYASRPDSGVAGMRIGVIRDFSFHDLDPQVEQTVRAALHRLTELGAQVREVSVLALTGGSQHEAFLDVMLYEFHQVLGEQWRSRPDRDKVFGPTVCANLERGTRISEQTYRTALASRAPAVAELRAALADADALLTPVLPMLTPRLDSPPELFERQRHFMFPFSFAGLPAISIPCGADRDGLPVGMQLAGDRLQEERLFRIAQAYESATDWHKRQPQRL